MKRVMLLTLTMAAIAALVLMPVHQPLLTLTDGGAEATESDLSTIQPTIMVDGGADLTENPSTVDPTILAECGDLISDPTTLPDGHHSGGELITDPAELADPTILADGGGGGDVISDPMTLLDGPTIMADSAGELTVDPTTVDPTILAESGDLISDPTTLPDGPTILS